ncbi:flagellar filament capping protein FliD [Enterobacter cloacae]
MAVNFMGVGSGLPFDEWLSKEREGQMQKLNPYLQKQSSYQGKISAWGSISNSLDALKKNMEKLEEEGFNGVSVGDNKSFKTTAGKGAIPNSYSVIVERLARAHQLSSSVQDSQSKQLGDTSVSQRTLKITTGGKTMEVVLKDDETSLAQIAKKVNDKNGDVTAQVMPAEGDKFKLVFTSKKTGEDGEMQIEVVGDDTLNDVLKSAGAESNQPGEPGYDPTKPAQVTPADNALIRINGEKVERSANTITDAITGITLELREVSEKDSKDEFKPETLAITADTSKVKSLIEEFVKNYNAYLNTAASVTKYKAPDNNTNSDSLPIQDPNNGALFSDGTLRRLSSQLKSTVSGNYGEASEVIQSLGMLGIAVKFEEVKPGEERSGTLGVLSIDNKKLDEALKNNPEEVEALFLGKGEAQGLKGRLEDVFKTYLGDSDSIPRDEGAINVNLKSLREQDTRVGKQIAAVEKRIEEAMLRREKEYMRLDKAMSDMNSMNSRLQSSLAGLI